MPRGLNSKQKLKARIDQYHRDNPTGGNPPWAHVTAAQEKIWLCEIETDHRQKRGTGFCRCTHVMYT